MVSGLSRSARLYDVLKRMIAETAPGDRLPAEPALAKQLHVSRTTLREALRTFETQGIIFRRQGSGTYVTPPPRVIDSGLEVLESIETMAARSGLVVTMGELRVENRLANEDELKALQLAPESKVVVISRTINAENHPVAYLVDILPENVLPQEDLDYGFTGSVLDLLLNRGAVPLAHSRCEINAVPVTTEQARIMRIQRGDVLLRFIALLYAADGRVVDYSFSYFLPGYFNFHVVRRVG